MKTMCGADCSKCGMKQSCKGCIETDGHPFGGDCITAECLKKGGSEYFCSFKAQAIREFNSLGISDVPQISELVPLCGAYVNLEYTLPVSDLSRGYSRKRTHFEREGLKPLLVAIKH